MLLLPPIKITVPVDTCSFSFVGIEATDVEVDGKDEFSKQVSKGGNSVYGRVRAFCTAAPPAQRIPYQEVGYIRVNVAVRMKATLIAYGPTNVFPNELDIPGPNYHVRGRYTNTAQVSGSTPISSTAYSEHEAGQAPSASANASNPSDVKKGVAPTNALFFDNRATGAIRIKRSDLMSGGYYRAVYQGYTFVEMWLMGQVGVNADGRGPAGRSGLARAEASGTLRPIPILRRIDGVWQ